MGNSDYKNYKLYILRKNLKERGSYYTLTRKIIPYLLRPITNLLKRSSFLIEIYYGIFPKIKQHLPFLRSDSGIIKLPQSQLIREVREFWYLNMPGFFNLDGEKITRKEIFIYGGPNPYFTCPICQKSEWLSRIRQKNLFVSHFCSQSKECQELCKKHGDELWTQFHQNFDFSIGCNPDLPTPKCLCIQGKQDFFNPNCSLWRLVFRRRLAYTCQVDMVEKPIKINWSNYDFIFMWDVGYNWKFSRPDIPVILYGHDFFPLEHVGYQWVIDWIQPDILLTPYPSEWKKYFRLPLRTKIVFSPFFDSPFFARPNLDNNKKLDLLVIGATVNPVYASRISLDKQILELSNYYKIEFFHNVGTLCGGWKGKVYQIDPYSGSPIRYLNKWSEYLGSAKYVIFGKIKFSMLLSKYYETLGSGAIPIFPEVPDLKLLGIKPFKHYIPLSEVEGNNERLKYLLNNYDQFQYIAKNAVEWYKKVSDKMIFNDFENTIGEVTNYKYPKRLI